MERLHNDYRLTNSYAIQKYGVKNEIPLIADLKNEKLYFLYPFDAEAFLLDMEQDFRDTCMGEAFFFTTEIISITSSACFLIEN